MQNAIESFQSASENLKEKSSEGDLVELRKGMRERIDQIEDDESLGTEKEREEVQKFLKKFIEELLGKKENFSKAFQTENGSMYFVSKNGQSWRFKKNEDGSIRDEPVLNKIIFISPEEKNKFSDLMHGHFFQENLVAFQGDDKYKYIPEDERRPYEIAKSEFKEGNFPLEIGISHFPEVVFEETDRSLKIVGTKYHNGKFDKSFASGIHLGHAITEIYRGN